MNSWTTSRHPFRAATLYLAAGVYFGIVLTAAEMNSWYRIQEMFHFADFHMYGILMTAILTAAISVRLIRRLGARDLDGVHPDLEAKEFNDGGRKYWMGGLVFGLGWGVTGACPGPIYTLIGNGYGVVIVMLAAALAGAASYYALANRLPG